ncbi:conserved hypothetical protein [Leishmania major strain Friedlin]|uniref:Uncharacterized protein n=1 Tax=Leishmania major TaxID=5664 RepID=Q4Q3P8_LEIMA|nr:conserved hypothetical protein [Leishmania major strain Friedlin]CAG9580963.1 hypothetical_protein_-_conserved [Leishmania major strain Friedlin]CAJ06805.1 conserved hypothetical protein [Leishmania major strain Friedlin]|eukprot:XP_001686050.1 conserved hypothetical protein [Leishmania major strain Friedlin]
MSQDTMYRHQLWHIEDPTLSVSQARLKLLFDFDPPSQYRLQPNGPLLHGIRPSCVLCGSVSPPGGCTAASAAAPITIRRMGVFGRVGSAPVQYEEPLVTEWADVGLPPTSRREDA